MFIINPYRYHSPTVYDADTIAYMTAIAIPNDSTVYNVGTSREATGSQFWNIVDKAIVNLKTTGVWSKLRFLHFLWWGDGNKNKINVKDPRDLDVAFRLSFSGGWTFDFEGSQPNGTNGYANTHFNSLTELTATPNRNEHMAVYSLTDNNSTAGDSVCDLGAWQSSSARTKLCLNRNADKNTAQTRKATAGSVGKTTYLTAVGYWLMTIREVGLTPNSLNNQRMWFWRDTTSWGGLNSLGDKPNFKWYFGAENFSGGTPFSASYSNQKYLLIQGGEGITNPEAVHYQNTMMTLLNDLQNPF